MSTSGAEINKHVTTHKTDSTWQ